MKIITGLTQGTTAMSLIKFKIRNDSMKVVFSLANHLYVYICTVSTMYMYTTQH